MRCEDGRLINKKMMQLEEVLSGRFLKYIYYTALVIKINMQIRYIYFK